MFRGISDHVPAIRFALRRKATAAPSKVRIKGLSFLKGEKKGEGAEEEISEEGKQKQESGAAVAEDEDQDSDSKEAITTVLSKVSNLSSFPTA